MARVMSCLWVRQRKRPTRGVYNNVLSATGEIKYPFFWKCSMYKNKEKRQTHKSVWAERVGGGGGKE